MQVLREVAVFDKINPGGHYAARVKQLGSYAAPGRAMPLRPAPSDKDPDINDPLWGNLRGEEDVAALWRLLRQLRLSCKGLLTHLMELDSRWGQPSTANTGHTIGRRTHREPCCHWVEYCALVLLAGVLAALSVAHLVANTVAAVPEQT